MADLFERPVPMSDHALAYGAHPAQVGDLWLPRPGGSYPLVVALHGGWWRSAHDRAHLGHLCRALRDEGFGVLNLEYRRLGMPGGGLSAMTADATAGVACARALARSYPIDPRPPLLLGHSAGGHLALWIAKHVPVRGVVALAPITDLRLAASLGLGGGIVDELLASDGAPREEAIALASPIERLPVGVRQIVLLGADDRGVPVAMSEAYVTRARAAGDQAGLRTLAGVDHVAPIDPESDAFPFVRDALRDLV